MIIVETIGLIFRLLTLIIRLTANIIQQTFVYIINEIFRTKIKNYHSIDHIK